MLCISLPWLPSLVGSLKYVLSDPNCAVLEPLLQFSWMWAQDLVILTFQFRAILVLNLSPKDLEGQFPRVSSLTRRFYFLGSTLIVVFTVLFRIYSDIQTCPETIPDTLVSASGAVNICCIKPSWGQAIFVISISSLVLMAVALFFLTRESFIPLSKRKEIIMITALQVGSKILFHLVILAAIPAGDGTTVGDWTRLVLYGVAVLIFYGSLAFSYEFYWARYCRLLTPFGCRYWSLLCGRSRLTKAERRWKIVDTASSGASLLLLLLLLFITSFKATTTLVPQIDLGHLESHPHQKVKAVIQ